jgi:hypothetical protein
LAISFYEQDWKWAQNKCLNVLKDENDRLSSLAATCLGHIARVHGKMEKTKVMKALKNRLDNPDIFEYVEDAINDINFFVKG